MSVFENVARIGRKRPTSEERDAKENKELFLSKYVD